MKLLVPYIDEMQPADRRLIRLAEFLGIECETVALEKPVSGWTGNLKRAVAAGDRCFVVNPRVMQEWTGGASLPAELVSFLIARFQHILFHSPRTDQFDSNLASAFSRGRLQAISRIERPDACYQVVRDSKDVCEEFAGLAFGPVNVSNDRFFKLGEDRSSVRQLISVGDGVLMGSMRHDNGTLWFLGSEDVADLDAEIGDAAVSEYFSRFLPHAMALRAIFGEESWRPNEHFASVIIDDPLLRNRYGFLNFESLFRLMKQHNFHTTVAFIPHNYRRSAARTTRLLRENADRFSLCFHGNDHTDAEFACEDIARLNTMMETAEHRMKVHRALTGLDCGRVMVFPQGNFSLAAMTVLKARSFDAAVNTVPKPRNSEARLTLGEIAQPAVLRYGNFPLFLRKDCAHTQSADIAFNCFFGKPTLIVEHHDIFRNPGVLAEAAERINGIAPTIHWSSLANAVSRSTLSRKTADGVQHIRAYSGTVQVTNDTASIKRYSVEWKNWGSEEDRLESQVLLDGRPSSDFNTDASGTRGSVLVPAHGSHSLCITRRNPYKTLKKAGIRHNTGAFLRRRLSEIRDNYLSKSTPALAAAKALQRCLPH